MSVEVKKIFKHYINNILPFWLCPMVKTSTPGEMKILKSQRNLGVRTEYKTFEKKQANDTLYIIIKHKHSREKMSNEVVLLRDYIVKLQFTIIFLKGKF